MPFSFKPPQTTQTPSAFSPEAIGARIKENKSGFFTFLCFVALGIVCFMAAVLYTYTATLRSQIASLEVTIREKDAEIGQLPYDEMAKLSIRLKIARDIVSQHATINEILRVIEETVEDRTVYSTMDIQKNKAPGMYSLKLSGKVPTYKAAIQQMETFKNKSYSKYIDKAVLKSASADLDGGVSFTAEVDLNLRGTFSDTMIFDKYDYTPPEKPIQLEQTN